MSGVPDKTDPTHLPMCGGMHCKGQKPGEPDHTCPYAEDVNNDFDTLCNCCLKCQQECADDI